MIDNVRVPTAPPPASGASHVRWVLHAVWLLVALVAAGWLALAGPGLLTHTAPQVDNRRLDQLQAGFAADRPAFTAAVARMDELRSASSDVVKVAWSLNSTCVTGDLVGEVCTATTPHDRALLAALHGVSVVIYQLEDDDRVFFREYGNDLPAYHLMYAPPGDPAPGQYARTHGFVGSRSLGGGWTVLGPIEDEARDDAQWIH